VTRAHPRPAATGPTVEAATAEIREDVVMIEYRAVFDADITFANGGGLQAQGFRLDIPAQDVSEADLADRFVRHLGLLMVEQVRLRNVAVVAEPHRGSREAPGAVPAAAPATRLVELNHVLSAGMVTYPGLPGPQIGAHLSREESRAHYAAGTEFTIGRVTMVTNTGTYVDAPYHRYPTGADLAGMPLSAFADLPIVVARVTGAAERGVGPLAFAPLDVAGAAVLIHTGWDRHFGTPRYGEQAPYLTGEAAEYLIAAGARLVGIDSVNIDEVVEGGPRPCHSVLLGAGIPVLEHLTGLDQLPGAGARLHAAPLRFRELGTFPVRAYALVPG
jgi:arylformamidase